MRYLLLVSLFFLFGCYDVPTSTSSDSIYAKSYSGSSEFKAAALIIDSKCTVCHTGYHSNWASRTTEEEWLDSGYVIAGSLTSSLLYTQIDAADLGGDMPPKDSGYSITDDELATIQTWITNASN